MIGSLPKLIALLWSRYSIFYANKFQGWSLIFGIGSMIYILNYLIWKLNLKNKHRTKIKVHDLEIQFR